MVQNLEMGLILEQADPLSFKIGLGDGRVFSCCSCNFYRIIAFRDIFNDSINIYIDFAIQY